MLLDKVLISCAKRVEGMDHIRRSLKLECNDQKTIRPALPTFLVARLYSADSWRWRGEGGFLASQARQLNQWPCSKRRLWNMWPLNAVELERTGVSRQYI
jgi:hypothetical protein